MVLRLQKLVVGEPITRGMDKYEIDNIPVIVYDTEGMKFHLHQLEQWILKKNKTRNREKKNE